MWSWFDPRWASQKEWMNEWMNDASRKFGLNAKAGERRPSCNCPVLSDCEMSKRVLFINRTEPKQRLNIGGVEVGRRESPTVRRTLVEDCLGLRSENYDHGWSVSPRWQTGSRCELNISTIYVTLFPIWEGGPIIWISGLLVPILPACVSRPLKCKRRMDR